MGLVNGLAVTRFRMPAFIVTLTSMMFFSGLAIWLTRSRNIGNLPAGFSAIGGRLWIALPLVALVAGAVHLMLSRSLVGPVGLRGGPQQRGGAHLRRAGAAAWSCRPMSLSGVLAAVAAVLYTGQAESGSPVLAQRLLLDIVGATVIGGTSLFGGQGQDPLDPVRRAVPQADRQQPEPAGSLLLHHHDGQRRRHPARRLARHAQEPLRT